jgi:lysophospholipase L1-like esterase
MRAVNVLISILLSLALGLLVLEGGLRLIGLGPTPSLVRFDANTGWGNRPSASLTRKGQKGEFVVHFETNAFSLRDDAMQSPDKPAGVYRLLALGDSFTLGFAVERADHFVDLLEVNLRAAGRNVEVLNVGTEGWDTAQAAAWLEQNIARFKPDGVLLLPYENDLYWNGQAQYQTSDGPRGKPRYSPAGQREPGEIVRVDKHWTKGWALTKNWIAPIKPERTPAGYDLELMALVSNPPAEYARCIEHTRGALLAIQRACQSNGAQLVVAPILGAAALQPNWREIYEQGRGLGGQDWSSDRPVEQFLALAGELGVPAYDLRADLRNAAAEGRQLYRRSDWHFGPEGSRVFAEALAQTLPTDLTLPAPTGAGTLPPLVPEQPAGLPFAAQLFLGLWLGLTGLFKLNNREEPLWRAALGVGAMLGLVFAVFLGLIELQGLLPAGIGRLIPIAFVVGILGFVVYKLGDRLGTVLELLRSFVLRGHWYLLPVVVVLLSIGSLLVVAASSPFIAPFIYTLF